MDTQSACHFHLRACACMAASHGKGMDGEPKVPSADRVYLKNLSFGVNKSSIMELFAQKGFPYVQFDDINIVRTRSGNKLCTAFVTMMNAQDVDTARDILHGTLQPALSPRPIHAERAVPRMSTMRALGITPKVDDAATESSSSCQLRSEPTEGEVAVHHLMQVKKENTTWEDLVEKGEEVVRKQVNVQRATNADPSIQPWKRRQILRDE